MTTNLTLRALFYTKPISQVNIKCANRSAFVLLSTLCLFISVFNGKAQPLRPADPSDQMNWSFNPYEKKLFIENKGQFDHMNFIPGSKIHFGVDNLNYKIFFTSSGLTYRFDLLEEMTDEEQARFENTYKKPGSEGEEKKRKRKVASHPYATTVQWENANPDVRIIADYKASEYFTYADPSDAEATIGPAYGYHKITYKNLYPHIDVEYVFHPKEGIKYSLIIHPGADPSRIRMKLGSPDSRLDEEGNLIISAEKFNIIEKAPQTFYESDKQSISSSFHIQGDHVSFKLGAYDPSRTIIIDPWVNPVALAMTTNSRAFDVERDAAGNVYIYGGFSPYKLAKYSATGLPLWTYSTPFNTYHGDLAVHPTTGECIITMGCCAGDRRKVSTAGVVMWSVTGGYEHWNIAINRCNPSQVVVGGYGVNGALAPPILGAMNPATGLFTSYGSPPVTTEFRSLCIGPDGNIYGLTCPSLAGLGNSLVATTPTFGLIYSIPSGYTTMTEVGTAYTTSTLGGFAGQNGIIADRCYVYTSSGGVLEKRNISTGAIIASVSIPGGVPENNSGITIDSCGNVYAGSQAAVYKFDYNLVQTGSAITPGAVYGLALGIGGEVLACGNGFVASLSLTACTQVPCSVATPALSFTSVSASCGTNNGSATVNVTGGGVPTTYVWSNGQITQTATALAATTYTVTVTTGCTSLTGTVTVGSIAPASGSFSYIPGTYCQNEADPSPVFSGGGTAGVFSSTAGLAFVSTGTGQIDLSTSTPGTYTVTNTSSSSAGCPPSTSTATITINPLPVITVNSPSICSGTNATLTAGGGTSYVWSTGQTINPITVSPAATTTYTVTGTASGCTNTSTAVVTVDPNASITLTSGAGTDAQSVCVNSPIATIAYSISGGGTGATVIGLPAGVTGSFAGGIFTITGTPSVSGTFNYTVNTTGTCTQTSATGSIVVNPAADITSIPFTDESACGANDGTITINATGMGLTYSIDGGITFASGSTFTGLGAGSYQIVVQNAAGCPASGGTISISSAGAPAAPTANATPNPLCAGSSLTLSVTTPIAGETYDWTGPAGYAATGASVTISSVTPAMSGLYTVTANDGTCVSAGGSVSVTVNPNAAISLTSSPGSDAQTLCQNIPIMTITYAISGGGTGGIASGLPLGITGSFAGGTFTISGSTPAPGTYNYTVNTTGVCTQTSASGSITVNPDAVIMLTSAAGTDSQSLCIGSSITPITYSVSGGGTGAAASGLPSGLSGSFAAGEFTISGTPSSLGSYNYIVTTSGTCAQTEATGDIMISPSPTPIISGSTDFCDGGSTVLSATSSVPGSGTITAYQWQLNGVDIASATASSYTVTVAGNYSVTVINSSGCSATSPPTTVTVNPSPSAVISGMTSFCAGNTTSLTATASTSGGGAITGYQWQFNGANIPGAVSNMYNAGSAGNYSVMVTNSNGCTSVSTEITITVYASPTATITGTTSFCSGQSTILSAASSTAGSGTISSYQWQLNGVNIPAATAATHTATLAGNYTVVVVNSNGCFTTSDPVTVTVNPSPLVNITGNTGFCTGGSTTLTANASPGGGGTISSYQWQLNGADISSATTSTYNVTAAGNYCVIVTNSYGCSTTSEIIPVSEYASPSAIITGILTFCSGDGTTLGATTSSAGSGSITSYQWQLNGADISSATASTYYATSSGNYTVVVTNSFGCSSTSSAAIVNVITTPSVTMNSPTICSGASANITATPSAPGGTYLWSPGNLTTAGITVQPSVTTSYTVSYSLGGCTSTCSGTVFVVPPPFASFSFSNQVTMFDPTVNFTNNSINATSWLWDFGDVYSPVSATSTLENPSYTYSQPGSYTVTLNVQNVFGCTDVIMYVLVIDADFTFYIPNAFSPDDDGLNDEFFGKGNFIDEYEMWIYDRWGNMIFNTTDVDLHWNGKVHNSGEIVQQDVYVYVIELKAYNQKRYRYTGGVTVVR